MIRSLSYIKQRYRQLFEMSCITFMNRQTVIDMQSIDSDISSHYLKIYDFAMKQKPNLIVELGISRKGDSSKIFSMVNDQLNSKIIGVDIENCPYDFVKNGIFVQRDDIAFGKTFNRLVSQPIDLLFIDTSHEYNHTVKEIEIWFPLLAEDALVMFHDTNLKDIYIRENGTTGRGWDNQRGVIRALEDYFSRSFDETKDFQEDINAGEQCWRVQHWPQCNGFTCLSKINK